MATQPRIVVIGSANMDLVVRTERIPAPGETVLGGDFVTLPGGKGANQAVAAARLGAEVRFVGCIGTDAFGDALLAEMTQAGIITDHLRRVPDTPSGIALIGVDTEGQNAIIVASGANLQVAPSDIDAALESLRAADIVLLQLEIPLEAVLYAVAKAQEVGTRVILNPAPVSMTAPFPEALLTDVEVLLPNEHEAAHLLDFASPRGLDFHLAAEAFLDRGVPRLVITLGAEGCVIADSNGIRRQPAFPVEAVDSTAAGDCFAGALAVGLAEGKGLDAAVRFASAAAALSVTRRGAQPSLPTRSEVETFLTQTPT